MPPRLPPPSDWQHERLRFVEAGGNTTHAFGLGRMIGRVYATLYLHPEPLALEEIAAQLSISKASASVVVRQLASLHAVRQVWAPGDRRDFYEAETDFAVVLREGLLPGIRKKLHSAGLQIERTLMTTSATLPQPLEGETKLNKARSAEVLRRLKKAQALHRRLDSLLASKLLAKFL